MVSYNLDELQNYMLDEKNIQKSLRHKINKEQELNIEENQKQLKEQRHIQIKEREREREREKEKQNKTSSIFIPKHQDTLFWCFYIIKNGDIQYEMLHNKNSLTAKQLKIEYVDIVRKNKTTVKLYKFDSITNIESNLVNDDVLNVKTFLTLCAIENINIVYVSKKTYFESFMNDTSTTFIVTEIQTDKKYNTRYGYELATEESLNKIKTTLYKIDMVNKYIKAISAYKVQDLVDICNTLSIEIINKDTGKNKSKKDLYESIVQYF